jgi:hypothetical protein
MVQVTAMKILLCLLPLFALIAGEPGAQHRLTDGAAIRVATKVIKTGLRREDAVSGYIKRRSIRRRIPHVEVSFPRLEGLHVEVDTYKGYVAAISDYAAGRHRRKGLG